MAHSFKPWILTPIFTVTSLAKGESLPSERELQSYRLHPNAGGPHAECEPIPLQLCHTFCHGCARKLHGMAHILPNVLSQACRAGLQVPVCSAWTLKKPLCFFLRAVVCCRVLDYNYVPQ